MPYFGRNHRAFRGFGFLSERDSGKGLPVFLKMKTPALLLLTVAFTISSASALDEAPSSEQLAFFERKIRPVLADKCYKCHSEKSEKVKGGLLLDTRVGLRRGGDNGPGVVPGNLKESLLIEALRYTNKDFAMPPEKSGGKLSDDVIKDFETWVTMGAPDSRAGTSRIVKKIDAAEARKWWAFQPVPPKPAAVPEPRDKTWARSDIDRLILNGLEAKGLKPTADADKAVLIRRVYLDLTGLPPGTQDIDTFFKDNTPEAFAKVVDRLLSSTQYGERWGRHWLDVARYAESTGKDFNLAFPHAWRYRDYVIGAFNADKPYDQFLREQIAGDLLPASTERQRAELTVATGFLAIGPKGLNEQNPRQFALDLADEQIDTVSQSILGLTVACARCHDHKFDPIPQREYYAMAGIFLSTETHYGTPKAAQNRHSTTLLELSKKADMPGFSKTIPVESRKAKELKLEELQKEQREFLAERFGKGGAAKTEDAKKGTNGQRRGLLVLVQIGQLEAELNAYDENGQSKALAMGVQDYPLNGSARSFGGIEERLRERLSGRPPDLKKISDSALYARGDADKPGERVPRGFLSILSATEEPKIDPKSSGRRELADWLTQASNPLTARVMANRTWHWLFGKGIVESTDNFGTSGLKPSNQALLDYLAGRLVADGWSLKKFIREIVLSRAYQMSSNFDEKNAAADPENTLLWRMSKRRLDAECIRDSMLAASGKIDLKVPLGSLIAQSGEGLIAARGFRSGVGEEAIIEAAGTQRSVYLPVARDVLPDALAAFDFAEPGQVTGARETTNVPAQALYMLNSAFVNTQAQALAQRILDAYPGGPNGSLTANFDQRLVYAYWLAFSRPPDPVEVQAASAFLARFPVNWKKTAKNPAALHDATSTKAAWTSLCRALFASAEFRYVN